MIYIILGTISEIIKFSALIRELDRKKIPFKIIHNGQNRDSLELFERLKLKKPEILFKQSPRKSWAKKGKILSLFIGSFWITKTFFRMYSLFRKDKPSLVFYQGDCISVPFTAIAAKLAGCKTAHRESGLRSNNLFEPFPEEIDRILGDFFGDYLFVPTNDALKNLNKYKNKKKIIYTGEGQLENLRFCLKLKPKIKIPKKYFLLNIHRFENITSKIRMKELVNILVNSPLQVIFPLNLNTKKKLEKFNLFSEISNNKKIKIIPPQDYITFAHLIKKSKAIITDSGGVQVEACILKVPCIVFRNRTEWEDAYKNGFSKLSVESHKILKLLKDILKKGTFYQTVKKRACPYSGETSKIISKFLISEGY